MLIRHAVLFSPIVKTSERIPYISLPTPSPKKTLEQQLRAIAGLERDNGAPIYNVYRREEAYVSHRFGEPLVVRLLRGAETPPAGYGIVRARSTPEQILAGIADIFLENVPILEMAFRLAETHKHLFSAQYSLKN